MKTIIGQNKLMNILNSYTISNLPKTMMLIGPNGCGKSLVAEYIANKFDFNFVELDNKVEASDIIDYLHSTINTLYLIDLDKFSEKQQNQFLKFIEEPSKSVYIILETSSEANVLTTILNRCIKHRFEHYTKEEIEQIINTSVNETAFNMFKTPGKLLNLTDTSFSELLTLAEKLVHKAAKSAYGNLLSVSTKINYKELYNKIDFNLFFDAVEYIAFEDYKINNNKQSLIVFRVTNEFKQYANRQNLIKETLMLNYLTTLWEALSE